MIKLQDKTNIDAPSAAYPFGSVRDKTPTVAGTRYDMNTMSDMFQFFEKMFNESGLTANGQLDNETNGYQLFEALLKVTRPYKTYVARLVQSGTNDPVVTLMENSLSATPNVVRNQQGSFSIQLNGEFIADKTHVQVSNTLFEKNVYASPNANEDSIDLINRNLGDSPLNFTDGMNVFIEVRIYE